MIPPIYLPLENPSYIFDVYTLSKPISLNPLVYIPTKKKNKKINLRDNINVYTYKYDNVYTYRKHTCNLTGQKTGGAHGCCSVVVVVVVVPSIWGIILVCM